MSKLINHTIYIANRYWTVLKADELLEMVYVQELNRNFCTVISYDEVRTNYPDIN